MAGRLIIDGNSVYEIDEECERTRDRMMQRPGKRRNKRDGNTEKDGESRSKNTGMPE